MRIFCIILLICVGTNTIASDVLYKKSTDRLQKTIFSISTSKDTTLSLWLTLDNTEKVPIKLSEESIRRRKKVDAVHFLINKHDSTFSQQVIDSLKNRGAEIRHVLYWFDAVTVNLPVSKLSALESLSFVKEIDIVQKYKSQHKFQATELGKLKTIQQKALSLPYGFSQLQNTYIKADKLHTAGLSGRGVRIAMFDTGFNTAHHAFDSANIVSTYNFIDNIVDVTQDDCTGSLSQASHGTRTFGIIGGYVPDTLIGVAYNAEFLLAKTEISCGGVEIYQEEDNWIAAAQWADILGADIISSSLGYITFQDSAGYTFEDLDGDIPRITQAADFAASKNILVVNSAGNERGNTWNHIITPADGDSVIAVGATNPDSSLASFSSPGPTADGRIKPDIVTLGTSVVTAYYTGGFTANASGTSFSAPLVAGGAALALEHDSTLTADELRELIKRSGDRFDNPNNDFGYGLFDAVKTADIIHFITPNKFTVPDNNSHQFLIETGGRSDIVPVISILDTIPGVSFFDNQDGTALIEITQTAGSKPIQNIRLTADVGYFADTTEFIILFQNLLSSSLIVGPNPCSDFTNIYFYDPENFESLVIYSISGEKIWEAFNNYSIDADRVRIEARWNCDNQSGAVVADGVYLIVVTSGGKQFHQNVLKIE